MPFTLADIPDLSGKLVVITGATGGLGYETALALSGAKATVVVTGRHADKRTDALARTPAVRVVTVSSIAHRTGRIRFDDLQWQQGYGPSPAYNQSKLANLLFAQELHRRSGANRWGIASIAAHPGISNTDLIANGMGTGI